MAILGWKGKTALVELDLHVHTHYSFDSLIKPQKVLQAARRRGLCGIAVTDHGTIRGGLEVQAANRDPDFLVIVGVEVHSEMGDILGLFLTAEIESRHSLSVVKEIHEQGGLAILPHPYKGHDPYDFEDLNVDGIEVCSARCTKAENAAALVLARHRQLPAICGSDAHFAREIGRATTWFDLSPSQLHQVNPGQLLEFVVPRSVTITYTPRYVQYGSQVIKHWRQRRPIALSKSLLMTLFSWLRHTRSR
jgi:predicted metal-dependent phosphoesterase TrpH